MSESQEHGGRWGGSQRTRATFRAVECANIRSAARNTLGQPASPLVGPVCARVTLGRSTSPENWTWIVGFPVGFPMVFKRFAFICVKTQLIFVLEPIDFRMGKIQKLVSIPQAALSTAEASGPTPSPLRTVEFWAS